MYVATFAKGGSCNREFDIIKPIHLVLRLMGSLCVIVLIITRLPCEDDSSWPKHLRYAFDKNYGQLSAPDRSEDTKQERHETQIHAFNNTGRRSLIYARRGRARPKARARSKRRGGRG